MVTMSQKEFQRVKVIENTAGGSAELEFYPLDPRSKSRQLALAAESSRL